MNAMVGVLRTEDLPPDMRVEVERVQDLLFEVGAFLADPEGRFALSEAILQPLWLERWIDAMQAGLPELRNFIVPAGGRPATLAHATRTVCRRAERAVVALRDHGANVGAVIPFLNRLSDAFFVLARWLNHRAGVSDSVWHARA